MTISTSRSVNLADPEEFVVGVPHDHFARLRQEAPVSWTPKADGTGYWSVVRHADILEVERDPGRFSSTRGVNPLDFPEAFEKLADGRGLITSDPPHHTFLRKLVNRGFTPKAIASLEDAVLGMAHDAVDAVIARGECDFVEVAAYVPVEVIAVLLGVPERDRPKLFGWTNDAFGFEDPECSDASRFAMAMMEMFAYSRRLVATKREEPADDILSVIAAAEEDGQQLSDLDLAMFFLLLTTAGNETTRTLFLQGQQALCEHPGTYAALRADRSLIPGAVEEMLRWTSPIHCMGRTASVDTELAGQQIAAGDQVMLWYSSANRDESVFTDPHLFDITRSDANKQMAFGGKGPHNCLGAALARIEGRILFEVLLERMPDIELAAPPTRLRSNFTNGIKRMPVRYTAGSERRPATERPSRPAMTHDSLHRPTPAVPSGTISSETPPVNQTDGPLPELVHLATATFDIAAPLFIPNGPKGTRVVGEIASCRWEGARFNGSMVGRAAADWSLIAPDGTAALDLRMTVETDDGALVYVSGQGRTDYSQLGAAPLFASLLFETGDERYLWLNKAFTVAKGTGEGMERLVYEIYEVH